MLFYTAGQSETGAVLINQLTYTWFIDVFVCVLLRLITEYSNTGHTGDSERTRDNKSPCNQPLSDLSESGIVRTLWCFGVRSVCLSVEYTKS